MSEEKFKTYRCDPDKNNMCNKIFCYRELKGKANIREDIICTRTCYKEYEMSIWKRIKEGFGIGEKSKKSKRKRR